MLNFDIFISNKIHKHTYLVNLDQRHGSPQPLTLGTCQCSPTILNYHPRRVAARQFEPSHSCHMGRLRDRRFLAAEKKEDLKSIELNYVDVYRNKVNVQRNKFKDNFCCSLALSICCPGNIRVVDSSATQRI